MRKDELFETPKSLAAPLRAFALIGFATVVAGLFLDPLRAWANVLLAGLFLAGIGLGALFFVALQHVSAATWATVIRRIPEAIAAALLPAGSALVLATVVAGGSTVYRWMGAEHHAAGFRGIWLDPYFFIGRSIAYVAVWIVFARLMRRGSLRLDATRSLEQFLKNRAVAAMFIVAFTATVWLASVDWVMTLDPAWSSTMFGVYHFAGMFAGGLAAIIVVLLALRTRGVMVDQVGEAHVHDLGKLLFAFSTFWMYIWFSQYMLIWYGNLAEEAAYFTNRTRGEWAPLFVLNVVLNWVVPFFVLLSSSAKKNERILMRVAVAMLVGHWLDLYLSIFPSLFGPKVQFGTWELGAVLMSGCAAVLLILRALSSASLVPTGDPMLEESVHHHA